MVLLAHSRISDPAVIPLRRRVRALLRRRIPVTREPVSAKLRYLAALRRLMRTLRARSLPRILAALSPSGSPEPTVAATARLQLRRDAFDDTVHEVLRGLRLAIDDEVRVAVAPAAAVAAESAGRVSAASIEEQFRAVEVDVLGRVPSVAPLVLGFVRRNVDLVTSVARAELDEVEDLVRAAVVSGRRVEDLADEIRERFRVGESRAELIAVDQVLKLHGEVTRERQVGLGVKRYTWNTVGDERVRPIHRELDGTVHDWNDPPVVSEDGRREHPGGDYRCRCVAVPLFESDLAFVA